jgi:hypothetical protein
MGKSTSSETKFTPPKGTYKCTATDFKNFVQILPVKMDLPAVNFRDIITSGNTTLCCGGISSTPRPGFKSIGVTYEGKSIFSMEILLNSDDRTLGAKKIIMASDLVNHLGAFRNAKEKIRFDALADYTTSKTLIKNLDEQSTKNNLKGFIKELLISVSATPIEKLSWETDHQIGLETAFSGYLLFAVWDRLSPAQKGLCLSNVGIDAYRFANGDSFDNRNLIEPSKGNPGLYLGDAFNFLQKGINSFALVRHWSELNLIYQVAAGEGTSLGIGYFSKGLGLLGEGLRGDSVPNMTQAKIDASGYKMAPQFGMGALYSQTKGKQAPQGYVVIHSDDRGTLAIPPANRLSAQGALVDAVFVGNPAGKASVSASAHGIYEGWDNAYGPEKYNATLAGSAIAAGLSTLSTNNPFLLGGIITAFVCYNCKKDGYGTVKSQKESVARIYKRISQGAKDMMVTLADGTMVPLQEYEGSENDSDDTYSNEVGFVATLCGITLARILAGGKSPEIDKCGEQIGDAACYGIKAGELDSDNLQLLTQNFKSIFAQAGIKSKSDAYQLVNQAFAEYRLNDTDTTAAQIILNIVYSDLDYDYVNALISGRKRGYEAIEATNEKINTIYVIGNGDTLSNFDSEFPLKDTTLQNPRKITTKDQMQAMNKRKYQQQEASQQQGASDEQAPGQQQQVDPNQQTEAPDAQEAPAPEQSAEA